ncbi:MAG: class III signal peptide-containing protein [Candidatus Diapherotrites archaeon]|nr:class III signal peptide-containing protein [Candidatus Diapherotrites archaeon]
MQIDSKAQGSIEYLLIIGAAILVVAIVILAITGALNNGTTSQLSTAVSTQGGAWSSITTTYNTAAGYTTQTTNIQQGNYFSIVGRDLTSTPTTLNTAIQNPTNGFTVTVTRNSYTTNYIYTTANGWNPTTANTFNLQIGDQLTGNNPSPTPITINLLGTDKTNDCTNNINILGGTPPLCCTTYPLITPCLRYQLAGLWRFNGDLSDSSGNNLNGTLSSGGNVTYLTGLFGRNYLNSSTVLNTAIIIPTFDNPVNTAALAPGTGSFHQRIWTWNI